MRKKKKKETTICDGDLFDFSLFEFDAIFSPAHYTLRDQDDDLFFRSTRHLLARFLSFSFPFGRSVDKTTTTTTTTTTHPSGGVRRGPLRSIASSSSSSSRERERERKSTNHPFGMYQRVSLSLSLVDQKTCVPKKAPFLLVKLTDPFVFFYPLALIVKIL